ncbi:MAG: isoprenylcysteine carboxylmethyltransferase family protein [Deltaproteobacteria bacterium]|nr:isoprenylcysteine carboxylmethyltransferase family protein [Deltaproteobacteria bacterium]
MSTTEQDAAAVRLPPPFVFVAVLSLGYVLHRWVWAIPIPLEAGTLRLATLLTAVSGGGALAAAMGLFQRSHQDPAPWKPTPEVLTSGVYRFTRNPMYVGMAVIQMAVAFHRGNGWMLLLVPMSLILVYLTAVRHEEAYLEAKFGDSYLRYKSAVRRWL